MKMFMLWPDDQRNYNWIVKRFSHPRGGDPGFNALPTYRDFICTSCGRIEYDAVFAKGFPVSATRIRGKGDILITDDNFWCVRYNVVELLRREGVAGVSFEQIERSEWYVINILQRLRTTQNVYRAVGETCPKCGRNTDIVGMVETEEQLVDRPRPRSVFTTIEYREKSDRDLIVDEQVLSLLLEGKIKGGSAVPILSIEEPTPVTKPNRKEKDKAKTIVF